MPLNYILWLEIIGMLGAALGVFSIVWWRGGRTWPLFEIGPFYICIVLLYTVFPLAIFLFRDHYGLPLTNGRLDSESVNLGDIAEVGLYGLVYIFTFSIGYLATRGNSPCLPPLRSDWKTPPILGVTVCFLIVQGVLVAADHLYAVNSAIYLDSYVAIDSMPLIMKQVYARAESGSIILTVMFSGFLFSRYRKYKWILIALAVSIVANTFYELQSRFVFAMFLATCLCQYNRFVVRLKVVKALAVSGVIVFVFVSLGYLRSDSGSDVFFGGDEFETVFVNGVDMKMRRDAGMVDLPTWLVLISPIANIVPQQLLPYPKLVYSSWYVDTFHKGYSDVGGGMAFGALAEAMIGFGLGGMGVRGLLLGLIFGWIHHRCCKRGVGFYGWSFYVTLMVLSYQNFRDNFGWLLGFVLHMWLPVIVAVYVADYFLKGTSRRVKRLGA